MRLLANLGGEEGPGWRALRAEPAVAAQAWLWRSLFGADAELVDPQPVALRWPEGLPEPDAPVFPWLAEAPEDAVVPWFTSEDALGDRGLAGRRLHGPDPATVRQVHDKAFAHATALAQGLVPPVLRDAIVCFSPEDLRARDAPDRIDAALAGAPEFVRRRFTLKPRIGTSGRGRVAGAAGRIPREGLGAVLERLADRGGALLEPWLERSADFSVQLHVGPSGVTLLASLEQELATSGHYLGHRGEVDSRGRVFTGHPEEEALREAAALLASAAGERGWYGPCGVDGFRFRHPESGAPVLRPVVELNARFTAGLVVVGLVRRALPLLKERLGLAPGERMPFRFRLMDPDPRAEAEPGVLQLAFGAGAPGPSLRFSREAPAPARP